MKFSDFQSESGTLKKMSKNGFGDLVEDDTLSVRVDPDFGWEHVFEDNGTKVSGRSTVVDTDPLSLIQDFWDDTHRNWVLTYKSKDWKVIEATPRHKIGGNKLEFVELILT